MFFVTVEVVLASRLSRLFQIFFSCGVFIKQWKTVRVAPVHKRDSKSDPTIYRPTFLLSAISIVIKYLVHSIVWHNGLCAKSAF